MTALADHFGERQSRFFCGGFPDAAWLWMEEDIWGVAPRLGGLINHVNCY